MGSRTITTVCTYGLLGSAAGLSFILPGRLSVPVMMASSPPETVSIQTLIRDMPSAHADFGVTPANGYGHYAGNVSTSIGPNDRPLLVHGVDDFRIDYGELIPGEPFSAQAAVLGAAITSGGTPVPVTVMVHANESDLEPFGAWDYASDQNGDINDTSNPRYETLAMSTIYSPGTVVEVTATSWVETSGGGGSGSGSSGSSSSSGSSGSGSGSSKTGGDGGWEPHMSVRAGTASDYVFVLKDGDEIPSVPSLQDQSSIESYLDGYLDTDTGLVTLAPNQAIYLFELGTGDLASSSADFQDLVLLVTMASDPSYFNGDGSSHSSNTAHGYKVDTQWTDDQNRPIAPHLYEAGGIDGAGNALADKRGTKGSVDTGGIDSAESFSQWYSDVVGLNLSTIHPITLTRDTITGIYEYTDTSFYPIDDRLLGNEGDPHNNYFSMTFSVDFTYDINANQFVEFSGGDGAWMYVDGKLIMDLGGVRPGTGQYASLDRLGLPDGHEGTLQFFYAHRDSLSSNFSIRTNLELEPTPVVRTVSSPFD